MAVRERLPIKNADLYREVIFKLVLGRGKRLDVPGRL